MKLSGSSSNADHHQNHSSGSSCNGAGKENLTENKVFVNHAELAWHQKRTEWVGDQSKKLQRPPKGSIISQTMTYKDLLLSREPFQQPIPLSEMVSFLDEIWDQEGLYY